MVLNKQMLLTSAFSLAVAMPLSVMADDNKSSSEKGQTGSSAQSRSDRDADYSEKKHDKHQGKHQGKNKQHSQDHTRNMSRYKLNMDGWVHVGVDYDRDGFYDAVETIFLYDLEKAQNESRKRSDDMKKQAQRDMQRRGNRRQVQLSGEIQKLQTKRIMSAEQKQVLAQIQTEEGQTQRVFLGPQERVSQLNLDKGDDIQIKGVKGRVNNQSAIMAQFVSFNGQSIQNELPRQQKLRKFKGDIVSTRKTSFQGRDGKFVVAKLETPQEKMVQVNLGPADSFEDVDLSEGTSIKLLARRGTINGQEALIAQLIRVDGQSIDVREPTERSLRKTKQKSRSDSENTTAQNDQQPRIR